MRLKLTLGKYLWLFESSLVKKPIADTIGSINRTRDGYIFYLDYDLMEEEWVKDELLALQERYDIGDILVFRSSEKDNKFHAVGFSKFTAKEWCQILDDSSCDTMFKRVPRFVTLRGWVLRNFEKGEHPKPKYLYILKKNTNRKQSYAHWKYFKELYPDAKINELTNSDGLDELYVIKYKTGNV